MVLRRYTPPTCTLEIKAKNSPLSRWAGQPVLKHLRFELSFDDPRQPEDKRVTIQGDRADLEALYDGVTSYVQNFLQQSSFEPPATKIQTAAAQEQPASGVPVTTLQNPDIVPIGSYPRTLTPYLQPRGLLSHDLFLGQMATEETGPVVTLSVLQLFDLATALDEYATELVALPSLKRHKLLSNPPAWTRTAAIFLLGVGLTAVMVKLLESQNAVVQTASTPQATPTTTAQLPNTAQSPLVTPTPFQGGAPTPPPLISASPTPSLSPSPGALSSSPIVVSPSPLTPPAPLSALPPPPRNISPPSFSTLPQARTSAPAPPQEPLFPPIAPGNRQQLPVLKAPPEPAVKPTLSPDRFQPIPSQSGVSAPIVPSQTGNSGGESASGSPSSASVPVTPPPLPDLPLLNPGSASSNDAPAQVATRGVAPPAGRREMASNNRSATNDGRLFDTIPQVAQIREYLQQRWKPPADLKQTLQYYLQLNPDGSIERIRPLGEASVRYIDNTGMPAPGKPFVSAIESDRNAQIRVVLSPDGKVETFLEP
ncbi:DUF4335 domain-containing protein [Trichocoleus sp. FACHB-90]|uniref:DUF4335 domain-containing protein n=1 Tax=Cyanophyceae TaxID=3028117 RepID=UPI001684527F|nr:DUF4335 domain-containing protein [Trichocoleus sp. FACHB-90]MBD1927515.1 DUF4335 domain-containing protein [Trichocoleus sp. FACHB-90]